MIDKEKLLAEMQASAKAACEAAGEDIVNSIDGYAEQQAEFVRVAWTAATKVMIDAAVREIVSGPRSSAEFENSALRDIESSCPHQRK